jgi:hypothetical protein
MPSADSGSLQAGLTWYSGPRCVASGVIPMHGNVGGAGREVLDETFCAPGALGSPIRQRSRGMRSKVPGSVAEVWRRPRASDPSTLNRPLPASSRAVCAAVRHGLAGGVVRRRTVRKAAGCRPPRGYNGGVADARVTVRESVTCNPPAGQGRACAGAGSKLVVRCNHRAVSPEGIVGWIAKLMSQLPKLAVQSRIGGIWCWRKSAQRRWLPSVGVDGGHDHGEYQTVVGPGR